MPQFHEGAPGRVDTFSDVDELRLILGARAIANALGVTRRQAFYWLDNDRVPGAFKVGRLWAVRANDLLKLGRAD